MNFDSANKKIDNILDHLSKFFGLDMHYIAKNGFWVVLAQIIISASAFVTTLILANSLRKELFGQYRFITTIIPIISLLTIPSLGESITRSVARGHKIDWPYIIRTKIKFGLLAVFASITLSIYYFTKGNILLSQVYLIVSIFISFYDLFLIYNNYLQGIKDFKRASIYLSITRILQALLIIIVAIATHDLLLTITAFFVGVIIPQIFFFLRTIKLNYNQKLKKEPEKNIIKYSIQLTAITGLILVTGNLDKFFTWHYLGAEQFAVYAIALTLPLNILLLFNFIPQIYFPSISTLTLTLPTRKAIIKRLFIMMLFLSFVALLYIAIAPWLLPFLFKNYENAIPVTLILAALVPLLPVNGLLIQIFKIHNMLKELSILRIILTVVFTGIFFVTYKTFPKLATAYAFIGSEFFFLILGCLILRYTRLKN